MLGRAMTGILFVLAVTVGISASVMGADILFISAMDATTQASDDALKTFLEGQGHTVTYLDDDTAQADMQEAAAAAEVVFVSESVSSGKVRTKITGAAIPMVITEAWAYDEMGLTNGTADGLPVATPDIDIVAPQHPLAAGLSGTVPVLTALTSARGAARFATGKAGGNATVIARATLSDKGTYDVIWVYEKGDMLPVKPADGSPQEAADVRVCLGFDEQSYLIWNQNAYALFEAAVGYAVGIRLRPDAHNPSPADGEVDVPCDAAFTWQAGADADAHTVYFGTDFNDVSEATASDPRDVLVSLNQNETTWAPGVIPDYGRTYYWRVDEVAANGTITRGAVWQFESEPTSHPLAGSLITATASSSEPGYSPQSTVNGSGLNDLDEHSTTAADMWRSDGGAVEPVSIQYEFDKAYELHQMLVWNYNGELESMVGFGLKEVSVQHSLDGAGWTSLGTVTFNRGTGKVGYKANTTVDFAGAVARYVRLVINSSWGTYGRHGLSEVRFFYVPTRARRPSPASGDANVDIETPLTWRTGRGAASHEVYFSTDRQAVTAGTALVATTDKNVYQGPPLTLGTPYYWKVNEVNAAAATYWAGDVWNFTTADFIVVEDFEQYTNRSPNRVFQTWRDGGGFSADPFFPGGYSGNGTGSFVGYDPQQRDIMETDTFHDGKQSVPFTYDNTSAATSEATRTFATARDWTRGGAAVLVLHFQGSDENTTGRLYVKINDAKVIYDGSATDLAAPSWSRWKIDLAAVATNLTNVRTLTIGVDSGGSGTLLLDDIRLYRVAPE